MNFQIKWMLSLGAISTAAALSGAASSVFAAPAKAPSALQVIDLAGRHFDLSRSKNRASVVIFIAHDCPISNSYAPEIKRLAAQYGPRRVDFLVVYADSDFSAAGAKKHAQQFGFSSPLLLDSNHRLSAALGASVTPEAVVLSPSGARLYLGRINDRYVTWGKTRQVSQNDLRAALDAVLKGQRVPSAETRAVGCFIPAAK